jgi:dTDP-3-amino-3,4,6-trideoxy-alpha-D-glucose transaminase
VAERSQLLVRSNDFARQWSDIRDDVNDAVDRVGRSGWLVLGEEVRLFEQELADWWGVPYAVGVASGMDALEIALRCCDLPRGARVLTTPLTAFATTLAIVRAGAEPVWVDVDETGGLDLDAVDRELRADSSILAVMPVHLYGHPMNLAGLEHLATEHDVAIIEDCAQSLGAVRDGRPTATAGIVAGTSLYPTKNLGALGDGGVLLTSDEALAARARRLRDYGQGARYEHGELGFNSRLDELHAAILRSAHMPRLDRWISRRREIAEAYTDGLRHCALRPIAPADGRSSYHLFPVEATEGPSQDVVERLATNGVAVGRHYPVICPDQLAVANFGTRVGTFPMARRFAQRELSLPVHPYLVEAEIEHVIESCLATC